MNFKSLLFVLSGTLCSMGVAAQNLYDVTDAYLSNGGFDSNYHYAVGETGNVAQEIKDIDGWTKDFTVDYTITGVYQLGTAKTFNNVAVPALGYDGTGNGGVLALSTGWTQSLKFYQEVTLPAGTYTIASAFYNSSDKTLGASLVGWIPSTGTAAMSALGSFPSLVWTPDSITFTLTTATKGRIQIGFMATQSSTSSNFAKVALDYIKLLRATPVGKVDVDLKKVDLLADIQVANARVAGVTGEAADIFKAVIAEAQGVYDNGEATLADVAAVRQKLSAALDTFEWANPTGEKPVVTTNKRFARGGTMAFGRLTVAGTDVVERGFCWATHPSPTINDNRTTKYIDHNGAIYRIENLTPATKYYMRAYAITKGKQVGYGEVIKFYTIPRGQLGYSMRSDGDADARARINSAMSAAVGWWNNLTSIQGVNFNVGHNPGTPTADCSYGGYIRVGSNTSYQRTGTMLHEMAHGVGVGTHRVYWESEMRSNGDRGLWLGDRVTDVVRFWDNSETATITGDAMHFWPYGINGAQEDNGTDALYIAQSLLIQGFGEDGLPPSGGFGLPAYSFDQEDTIKYYLKNESANYGLTTSYMVENASGSVALKDMTNADALANDSAAWNVTFNPNLGFYAFRNVATGHYLTYVAANGSIRATAVSAPGANNLFHLMRSRVDAIEGSSLRGYWIIRNNNVEFPNAMTAKSATTVGTATYNLSNNAKDERWLILNANDMEAFEQVALKTNTQALNSYLAQVKKLRETPHSEDVAGADQTLSDVIASIETQSAVATSSNQVTALLNEARVAGLEFLSNVTPLSTAVPFDLTFMVNNPGMDNTTGWSGSPALNYSAAEFYQTAFDFNQTISNLPAGTYQLKAQAFQRPGSAAQTYTDYLAGTNKVNTFLYIGSKAVAVKNAVADAQQVMVGVGNESTLASTPSTYIPNDMQSAAAYFAKGLYDNEVFTDLATDGGSLKVGIRSASSESMYWSIFDNFRLYYYGSMGSAVVANVRDIAPVDSRTSMDVYSLDGRLVRKQATDLNGLPHGIYVVNGKKIVK